MEAILCSPPEKPAFPVDSGLIRCFHQTLHQSNFHGCPPSHGVTSCCDVLSPCTLYLPSPARKTAWVSISQIRKLRSRGVKRGTWELLPQIIRGWQVALSLGCLAFAHGQGVELLPKCWLSHRECESLVLWKEEVISCESAPAHCRTHTRHTSLLLPGPYNGHLAPVFAALICVWVLSLKFSFLCESQDCSILSVCLPACVKVTYRRYPCSQAIWSTSQSSFLCPPFPFRATLLCPSPFICSHLLAFFFILFFRLLEAFFPLLLCQVNGRVLVWVFQRNRISRGCVCWWGWGGRRCVWNRLMDEGGWVVPRSAGSWRPRKAERVVPVSVQRPENQESHWYEVLVQKPADCGPGKSWCFSLSLKVRKNTRPRAQAGRRCSLTWPICSVQAFNCLGHLR